MRTSFNHLNEAISRWAGVTVTLAGCRKISPHVINTHSSPEDAAAFPGDIHTFDLERVNEMLQVRRGYLCASLAGHFLRICSFIRSFGVIYLSNVHQ